MKHDIDLLKKTVVVAVFLLVAYIGFEAVKRSSYVYQKESLIAHLQEFGNTYIKDKEDRARYEFYVKQIKKIIEKYGNSPKRD